MSLCVCGYLNVVKQYFARITLGSVEAVGKHLEAKYFRLMINCAEIYQTSADFLLSGSVSTTTCAGSVRIAPRAANSSVVV